MTISKTGRKFKRKTVEKKQRAGDGLVLKGFIYSTISNLKDQKSKIDKIFKKLRLKVI